MPQLDQLSDVILSQFLWLGIVLGLIYFVIGKGMVPKIQSTVDARAAKIAEDLAAAEAAQAAAERVEEDYRLAMDASRGEAAKLTAKAKADGAKSTEKLLAEADAAVGASVAEAEARIRASRASALAEIEAAASELAAEVASKVAGVSVGKDKAAAAVKAVMADA